MVVLSDKVLCLIFTSTETKCQEVQNFDDCFVINSADQRFKVFKKGRNDLRIGYHFYNGVEGSQFHDVLQYINDILHISISKLEGLKANFNLIYDFEELELWKACVFAALDRSCEVFEDFKDCRDVVCDV